MRTSVIDLDDDPATAAALFERAAPDLGEPKAMRLESGPPHDVARWAVRTAKGAWRMKVATDPAAKARLRWGAGVLAALAERAVAVPRVDCVRGGDGEAVDVPLVVLESRLGQSDAAARWDRLPPAARDALLDPLAKALAALHAVPAAALPRNSSRGHSAGATQRASISAPTSAPAGHGLPHGWRSAVGAGVAKRVGRLREQACLPSDLLARVEARLVSEVERIPDGVERRLCHGRVRPSSIALEVDAFAGLVDFEDARVADPWTDAALWMLSTGDPAGKSSRRFLEAFGRERPRPADLATRIDACLGLETLRVVTEAADLDAPEAVDALGQALEQWISDAWLL
jgi:aminoglycoside phosphotransferase (APT) family kinase protein